MLRGDLKFNTVFSSFWHKRLNTLDFDLVYLGFYQLFIKQKYMKYTNEMIH